MMPRNEKFAPRTNWNYGQKSIGSKVFDVLNVLFMLVLMIVTIYPFLYVVFASVSDPMLLMSHRGILWAPLGFSTRGYELVFKNAGILNGFRVTLFVVIVGTLCNMVFSLLFAYVLSRRNMMFHSPITFIAIFTMYFSGGMIPTYLIVRNLGLVDSLWSLILPGLIGTYNVIILRTALRSVPYELEESAKLDGAGDLQILVRILIPLIVPTIAAISLFYMVGHWNSWSSALIYIKSTEKYPLQLVLRALLVQNLTGGAMSGEAMYEPGEDYAAKMLLKYATVVVSIVPIICVYPFLQKYFTKGVMIGAVKG
jgi:putative aldouronate transport system permease protein